MIRACCGTPDDRRAPSPHARDCRAVPPAAPAASCLGPIIGAPRDRDTAYALADGARAGGEHATVTRERGRFTVRVWPPAPGEPCPQCGAPMA